MHTLTATKDTSHGYWSRDLTPLLTIDSGETVRFTTLCANWQFVNDAGELERVPYYEVDPGKGHALVGPVYINGAKPGMTLEVQIGEIVPAALGWNRGGGARGWDHWERLGVGYEPAHMFHWSIDYAAKTATNELGHTIPIRPFMGVMGNALAEPGQHTTRPPRSVGGNIDCKELVAGTSLYLPIAVDGALFSTGDGHAVQSDGEASCCAVECPMERADLTFVLHEDMALKAPRARTAEGWITFGFDESLDNAMYKALNGMLDLMVEKYGISRKDAMALSSLVVDLRVTQVVNLVLGVHAVLREEDLMING